MSNNIHHIHAIARWRVNRGLDALLSQRELEDREDESRRQEAVDRFHSRKSEKIKMFISCIPEAPQHDA